MVKDYVYWLVRILLLCVLLSTVITLVLYQCAHAAQLDPAQITGDLFATGGEIQLRHNDKGVVGHVDKQGRIIGYINTQGKIITADREVIGYMTHWWGLYAFGKGTKLDEIPGR